MGMLPRCTSEWTLKDVLPFRYERTKGQSPRPWDWGFNCRGLAIGARSPFVLLVCEHELISHIPA